MRCLFKTIMIWLDYQEEHIATKIKIVQFMSNFPFAYVLIPSSRKICWFHVYNYGELNLNFTAGFILIIRLDVNLLLYK